MFEQSPSADISHSLGSIEQGSVTLTIFFVILITSGAPIRILTFPFQGSDSSKYHEIENFVKRKTGVTQGDPEIPVY